MRRFILLALLVTVVVLGSGMAGSVAAATPDGGGVERIVRVHYPHGLQPEKPTNPPGRTAACPDPTTCADFKYSGYRWLESDRPVAWEVNYADSGGNAASFGAAISASFAVWDDETAATVFGAGERSSCTASSLDNVADGTNCVSWQDISAKYPGAIAVTFIWRTKATKAIAEVDTVMGSDYTWTYDAPTCDVSDAGCNPSNTGRATYDVQDILTHEVGHWLMLNDLYTSRDSELTMYGYGSVGELKKDSLGYGDVLGVQKIYGP